MTQVKTKAEFQAKQKQMEQEYIKKPKNPNHRVTPNLTPRGRDILMRLQNKSLDTTGDRSYTLNEDIVNARLKSKHELIADAKANQEKINSLKSKLNDAANTIKDGQAKAAADEAAAKAAAAKPGTNDPG